MPDPKNQVLTNDASSSSNFYESDLILRHYFKKHFSDSALKYMDSRLQFQGIKAATEMDSLSLTANKKSPEFKKRDPQGEPVNDITFHPAYWGLVDIAARSEMFYVKYDSDLRRKFAGQRHKMGFAAGQLYAMSELGVYCPLCMTDGATHLVDRYASEEVKERLLPRLSAKEGDELYTGAMFLTEKSGGSDVGRNLCTAEQIKGKKYKLNGEKWFCSNVNADVIMALARTDDVEKGTRGLSLFLVEKKLKDGSPNSMNIIRLKDKLGVRSMATGEVELQDTIGIRLGEENNGFKLMAEMINISRLYNSVAAMSGTRRAIIEAWEYLNHRVTFGEKAVNHALIRQKFHELGSKFLGNFLLVWRAIRTMDDTEEGSKEAAHLMRMIIPMAKWWSANQSVYIVRECMELMGGNGYIEDFVMPKLLRDVNVLPIWEGAGNIMVLDMLRASQKSDGLDIIIQQIRESAADSEKYGSPMSEKLNKLAGTLKELEDMEDRDTIEATAKPLFEELIKLYQMVLMIEEKDEISKKWLNPALRYMASEFDREIGVEGPISLQEVENLVAWDY